MDNPTKRLLASKYADLNALLTEKATVDKEISELRDRISALTKRANELDHKFHKLAIEVEPTEVLPAKGEPGSKTKRVSTAADKIVAKIKEQPELLENQELMALLRGLI